MSAHKGDMPEFVRQLSWTQASLDLCLDMERNRSDSRFAARSEGNEIVYVFDESVFELFVGGFDEPPVSAIDERIYTDRRRSVGIFNMREWREQPSLTPEHERSRISINRQSAILASEWLFGGTLPGMKGGVVYISEGHLTELRSRWEKLATYYRKLVQVTDLYTTERAEVKGLLDDQASLALEHNGSSTVAEVEKYLEQQIDVLRTDLKEFWASLSAQGESDPHAKTRSFWRYAFSRRLADKLSALRAIGPLSQLIRINTGVAGRLRMLDFAGELDSPAELPSSERQSFWEKQIEDEILRRERLGFRVDRRKGARANDAATLTLVQSLANTSVRQNNRKVRYLFVTADNFIIDLYRAWHCHFALNFEPFVIRPVRHFAPLLNIASMADKESDTNEETQGKRDIFPGLQAAINPFLLTLNLSNRGAVLRKPHRSYDDYDASHDDPVRWPREMFALHLRRVLQEYDRSADPDIRGNEQWLRNEVADTRFFSGLHFQKLVDADKVLRDLSEQGRQIERSAIGLGLPWLGAKLDGLKVVAEVLDNLIDRDETALAAHIQDMVDRFGNANLDLQARSLSIAEHLRSVVEQIGGVPAVRVPLSLDLNFVENDSAESIEMRAMFMVDQANTMTSGRRIGKKGRRAFRVDLQGSTLARDGGYRLLALFACVALRLNEWELAQRYAEEALYRVTKFSSNDLHDIMEVQYLSALCTRFQIGGGVVVDAAGFDITEQRYEAARDLLKEMIGDENHLKSFVQMRAASELVALKIFVSIWSIAKDEVSSGGYPKVGADVHFDLLDDAWRLTRCLRDAVAEGVSGNGSHAQDNHFVELVEQIHTNAVAVVILAHIVKQQTEDHRISAILEDPEIVKWLDQIEPVRPGHSPPPITAFYRHWYLRVRDHEAGQSESHFTLDLRVDRAAQKLFQRGV